MERLDRYRAAVDTPAPFSESRARACMALADEEREGLARQIEELQPEPGELFFGATTRAAALVRAAVVVSSPATPACERCGARVADGSQFCSACEAGLVRIYNAAMGESADPVMLPAASPATPNGQEERAVHHAASQDLTSCGRVIYDDLSTTPSLLNATCRDCWRGQGAAPDPSPASPAETREGDDEDAMHFAGRRYGLWVAACGADHFLTAVTLERHEVTCRECLTMLADYDAGTQERPEGGQGREDFAVHGRAGSGANRVESSRSRATNSATPPEQFPPSGSPADYDEATDRAVFKALREHRGADDFREYGTCQCGWRRHQGWPSHDEHRARVVAQALAASPAAVPLPEEAEKAEETP